MSHRYYRDQIELLNFTYMRSLLQKISNMLLNLNKIRAKRATSNLELITGNLRIHHWLIQLLNLE